MNNLILFYWHYILRQCCSPENFSGKQVYCELPRNHEGVHRYDTHKCFRFHWTNNGEEQRNLKNDIAWKAWMRLQKAQKDYQKCLEDFRRSKKP